LDERRPGRTCGRCGGPLLLRWRCLGCAHGDLL